ncbi:MAG: SprB repeat-containing protein [Flavobacteriales bacterium]|nr:SprB repeat-containing protein [Flavobacteriales bacterium]
MYGPPLFCALALWSAQAQANISFTIAPEHCSNADGSVNATVTGGVPPYSYSWSSGPTSEDIHGLPAGSYTLTVTDFLGAVQQNTAVVPNLPGWEWIPAKDWPERSHLATGSRRLRSYSVGTSLPIRWGRGRTRTTLVA